MISRLEVANFHCLREPQVIDLRVAANVPDEAGRFAPVWRDAKEPAVKVIALFGANVSGKSTVLRVLAFLSRFVSTALAKRIGIREIAWAASVEQSLREFLYEIGLPLR